MHIQEHLSKWMQHNVEKAAGNFCSVLFLPTFEGQTAPRNVRAPLLETSCRFSFPSWKPALAASFQVHSELTSHSLSCELQLNRIRLSDKKKNSKFWHITLPFKMRRASTQTQRNRRGVSMAEVWFSLFPPGLSAPPVSQTLEKVQVGGEKSITHSPAARIHHSGGRKKSVCVLFLRSIGHHCRFSLDVLFSHLKN